MMSASPVVAVLEHNLSHVNFPWWWTFVKSFVNPTHPLPIFNTICHIYFYKVLLVAAFTFHSL